MDKIKQSDKETNEGININIIDPDNHLLKSVIISGKGKIAFSSQKSIFLKNHNFLKNKIN